MSRKTIIIAGSALALVALALYWLWPSNAFRVCNDHVDAAMAQANIPGTYIGLKGERASDINQDVSALTGIQSSPADYICQADLASGHLEFIVTDPCVGVKAMDGQRCGQLMHQARIN